MLAIRSAGKVEPAAPRPRRRSARACAMRTTGPAASPASSARCVAKLITIAAAQAQQHGIAPQNRGSAEARDGCVPQAQQAHLLTPSRARIGKGCYRFHQKLFNGCRARESPPIERFKRVSCAGRAQGLSQKLVDYDPVYKSKDQCQQLLNEDVTEPWILSQHHRTGRLCRHTRRLRWNQIPC